MQLTSHFSISPDQGRERKGASKDDCILQFLITSHLCTDASRRIYQTAALTKANEHSQPLSRNSLLWHTLIRTRSNTWTGVWHVGKIL